MKDKKIEIRVTKDDEEPRYIVYGDSGHTIYGAFKNFDEAARKKKELEKKIDELEHEKFLMKLKK